MKIKFIALTATFIILSPAVPRTAHARPQETAPSHENIVLDETRGRSSLGRTISILEDKTGKMTIREASSPAFSTHYTPSTQNSPSFGFNNISYWTRFRITNPLSRDELLFLELEYPHMDIIEVYYPDASGKFIKKVSGDIYTFDKREIDYRNFVFAVPVKQGRAQTVYLRFAGSCSKQFTLTLWRPGAFSEKVINENLFLGVYYGIILVMVLYNLFIFFFIKDISYLYYVIYIASYGLVQMAYNGLAYKYLWPMFPHWHNISIPFLIGLAIFWMSVFTRSFLHLKEQSAVMSRSMYVIMAIGIVVMGYSIFGNYLIAIESAMILMVMTALVIIISAVVCMRKGFRPARFFLPAWLFFLFGLVMIALNKLNVLPIMFITENANQIGSALEATLISVALADRINIINQEKTEAQQAAIQAQEKYKLLVEGTNDIIFSLDGNWNFITVNKAFTGHFKKSTSSVSSMNFLDLIYDDTDAAAVSKKLIREKLCAFLKKNEQLSFKAMFRTSILSEPKEMEVRLEHINIEGKDEILGKAAIIEEDVLMQFFDSEQQNFSIGNYIMAAEDITQRITRNLKKYTDHKHANLIRIALREIIINSIEHGNLAVTFNEKSEATAHDSYFDFIASRRQDQRYRGRRVFIEYSLNPIKVVYRITDEGDGFDHERILDDDSNDANRDLLAHGRGISMANNIFDSVRYNQKGNQVTLMKKFTVER